MDVLLIKANIAVVLNASPGSSTGEVAKRLTVRTFGEVHPADTAELFFFASFKTNDPQVIMVGLVYQVDGQPIVSGKNECSDRK